MKRRWMAAAWLALGWIAPATGLEAREPAPQGEWVSLFDGKSLGGWDRRWSCAGRGRARWEVKDGAIVGTRPSPRCCSAPRGDYKNFRYKAELKINDKGNSGMYVRTLKKAASFTKGYEVQVNSTHADPIKTGSLYTHWSTSSRQLVKPGDLVHAGGRGGRRQGLARARSCTHSSRVTVDGRHSSTTFIDHSNESSERGLFRLPAARPGQQGSRSARSR